jgi:arginase family enzyme
MRTTAIFYPFDLFGSSGAAAGAELLADAVREMQADNRRERRPARSAAYRDSLRVREHAFSTLSDFSGWRKQARKSARDIWRAGDFLIWGAGNHLSTLPLYEELGATGPPAVVVQFDAHLDVYNLSDCTEELSHGNFLLHAEGPLPAVVNVGHRDLFLPRDHLDRHFAANFAAHEIHANPERITNQLAEFCRGYGRVFLDIDCDVFDPAFFPAVAGPLPFGLAPRDVLRIIDAVWSANVVGVAVSEFVPARDRNDQSLGTLVWLLEYLLLKRHESAGR